MDHLVRVEVTGIFPIVSVTGYRDDEEVQFDGDRPLFDGEGNPVVKVVRVAETEDVSRPGFAMLDPEVTNIRALVRAGLVKLAPQKKPAAPTPKEA